MQPPSLSAVGAMRCLLSRRALASLACAVSASGLWVSSAQAQGLRLTPQFSSAEAVSGGQQRTADSIVAVVNAEAITHQQVLKRVREVEQQRAGGVEIPPAAQLYQHVLEQLIAERIQVQHAIEVGLRISDAEVDAAVSDVAKQNQLTLSQLSQRLRTEGLTLDGLKKDVRDQLSVQRLREREVVSKVRLTDAELDVHAREHLSAPSSEPQVDFAQILVPVPENASQAQTDHLAAKAQRAYERVKTGEDFAAVARQLSEADEANPGGPMGLRSVARYPNLFVESTQAVGVGEVVPPVRSAAGFHVLKVIERRQAAMRPKSVEQTRVRHILLRTAEQLNVQAAVERLSAERKKILAGSDFAAVAREVSQDGSASDGGDLGWAMQGQFVPEFEEAMRELRAGEVSEPVVSRFGVHLIQVLDRAERELNPAQLRELARSQLREKKLNELYESWAQDLRARAYVELRDRPIDSR